MKSKASPRLTSTSPHPTTNSWKKWGKVGIVVKSGEKWRKVAKSEEKVRKSGEKWEKWRKVAKSGEKWGKVAKSVEKWWKVAKVGNSKEKVAKSGWKVARCGLVWLYVGNSGKSGKKWEIVVKSGEKLEKVGKSGEKWRKVGKSGEKWFYVVQSMYYLKDNTWTLQEYHKVPCITSSRTHGNTHRHTQTNKVIAITLLCKIKYPRYNALGHLLIQNWSVYWSTVLNGYGIMFSFSQCNIKKHEYYIQEQLKQFLEWQILFHSYCLAGRPY